MAFCLAEGRADRLLRERRVVRTSGEAGDLT